MKKILEKLEDYRIPFDTGKFALFVSVLAFAYVASSANTPCLSASTCAVGSDPVFEDNVGIKGGTAFTATLDASLITNDRNIQLPDTDGTLAVTATLAGNKMLRTNVSGEIEVDSATYPVTLSPDLPLYTSATGEVTAGAFDASILGIGAGLSNQVLAVNGGGNALTWATINGVPSLTANKPLISDGLGALTTANLTADKIMVTDTNGNLDTTNVYPLSFSANKPVVTDGAGNLTDITLNANENVVTDGNGNLTTSTLSPDLPVITDGNGNLTASKLDPETDLTTGTGSAGQVLAVNSGSTALEFIDAGGGGQWSLVASGQSQQATGGMISGDSNTDQVILCWGGANSTDGVDGNYFRMTSGKQYKLVLSTKANLNGYYNSSTSYNNIGTAWIGNGVDCSNGTVPTNNPTANGYNYLIDNYFLHPSGQGTNYVGTQAYYCNLFAGQTVNSNNMPESWHGEIILNDFQTYFGSVRNGVTAMHDIRFAGNHVSQSPYIGFGGHSTGVCEAYTSTPGGYISDVNDIYGLYFRNLRPSSWNSNAQTSLLYWLYESNDYNNKP